MAVCCQVLAGLLGLASAALSVLFVYRGIFALLGLFRKKEFPPARRLHKYAVLVAARNEEAVIGQLLESIRLQEYPAELLRVFVVADNCTDATALLARQGGAVCYERFDQEHCTKGYALQFLLEQIRRDYGIASFEGYLLLDADNLLKSDYMCRMNDAFDSGEKVITGYRNTKNFQNSPLAASYAFHWMRLSRLESRGRSLLGISTRLTGTGFLFASELMADGWKYVSLTEDRAFTADAVLQGYHITYQEAAEFYDEQPVSLPIALRQRIRWGKGHLQGMGEYGPVLFRQLCRESGWQRKAVLYDTLMTMLPSTIIYCALGVARLLVRVLYGVAVGQGVESLPGLLLDQGWGIVVGYLATIPMAVLLLWTERERLPRLSSAKAVLYCAAWPIFTVLGDLGYLIAFFTKVSWKPIPHRAAIRIGELSQEEVGCEREQEGQVSRLVS